MVRHPRGPMHPPGLSGPYNCRKGTQRNGTSSQRAPGVMMRRVLGHNQAS
jgi:hypothetical protein